MSHKWIAKRYITRLTPENPPYQVDDEKYRRFDQRDNLTIGRPNWDEKVQAFSRQTESTRVKRIEEGHPDYGVRDYSLFLSGGVMTFGMGSQINHSNRGVTSWESLGNRLPEGVNAWVGSPEEATRVVKRVASFLGADMVGIAPSDRRWFFSHAFWSDGTNKEISFESVDVPQETEDRMIVPESMRWVIVMGARMDPDMIRYSPAPLGCAETRLAYSRMGLIVAGMAEFLRGIGYNAIPSINDLALNIPLAIDAGFGEQGRHGKLITPQYGPSIRLCKVITDLPLTRDLPIRFGAGRFCEVCKKCAEECPAQAIPRGRRTWERPNLSNNPGVHTWYLDNEACRRYWSMGKGTNCTSCIRSCPFTKQPGLIHDITRTFISRFPQLDRLWLKLDTALGYGRKEQGSLFWGE